MLIPLIVKRRATESEPIMNKADRDRESIAVNELAQSCVLLKLGSRAFLDLHERHPKQHAMIKLWVEHHRRHHEEVWDELLGKVCMPELLSTQPREPDESEGRQTLEKMMKATGDLEQVLAWLRDLFQTRPDKRDWALRTVAELRRWAQTVCDDFGRQIIAVTYTERLDKLGRPSPIGVATGEPIRPLEPQPKADPEYLAWLACNPDARIDPLAGPEDFVVKHPDDTVTRIRDLLLPYRRALVDRSWGRGTDKWDAALLTDLVLVRACAVRVTTVSHLQWWLAPLRSVVESLDQDNLVQSACAVIANLMDATPMMLTVPAHGHGWVPTHRAQQLVADRILPQWRGFSLPKEGA